MEKFIIGVGETSDVIRHRECAKFSEQVPAGGLLSARCNQTGRYVSLRKYDGKEVNLFTICELIVTGYKLMHPLCPYSIESLSDCPVNTYGKNCAKKCGACQGCGCSADDGHCPFGCALWFFGNTCQDYIHLPSLLGTLLGTHRWNGSSVIVEWLGASGINENFTGHYGYTILFRREEDDLQRGPSISHELNTEYQRDSVNELKVGISYCFMVQPYREMSGYREYGLSSRITCEHSSLDTSPIILSSDSFRTELPEVMTTSGSPSWDGERIIIVICVLLAVVVALAFSIVCCCCCRCKGRKCEQSEEQNDNDYNEIDESRMVDDAVQYENICHSG